MNVLDYPTVECSCPECQGMCQRVPCWGTPDEIKKLIEKGYSNKLRVVTYYTGGEENIRVLSPKTKNEEDVEKVYRKSSLSVRGTCTFYNKEGLCDLHDKGLKPLEGRIVDHNREYDPHTDIAKLWNNKQAQELVNQWLNGEI